MAFKMKGCSPLKQTEDNPDVRYKETVRANRKGGTTTTIKGDAYSDIESLAPSASGSHLVSHTHVDTQPYIYKGVEGDVSIWQHRLKSKTDESGNVIKRKEKVVYDDGNQMKKVKQRKVKWGKNKGKIKTTTTHINRGEKTKTKTYSDKVSTSPILSRKKY